MKRVAVLLVFLSFFAISCNKAKVENKEVASSEPIDKNIYPKDGKIEFAGIVWKVADNTEPQSMEDLIYVSSNKNVFVDSLGNLHLVVKSLEGSWLGAEIESEQDFPFGDFDFTIETNLDAIDSNCIAVLSARRPANRKTTGMTECGIRIYGKPLYEPDGNIEYYLYSTDRKFALVEYPKITEPFEKSNTLHSLKIYQDFFEYSTAQSADGKVLRKIKIDKKTKIAGDDEDKIVFAKPGSPMKVALGFYLYDLEANAKNSETEIVISNFKHNLTSNTIAGK